MAGGAGGGDVVRRVLGSLDSRGETLAVAESCTGGGLGARLTSVAGASRTFRGGVIAYSDELKRRLLAVPPELIDRDGAVSGPVARAMASGVREATGADWGISVTGVAGPGGGSEEKPVGTVWIAIAGHRGSRAEHHWFEGDRATVRDASVGAALGLLARALEETDA